MLKNVFFALLSGYLLQFPYSSRKNWKRGTKHPCDKNEHTIDRWEILEKLIYTTQQLNEIFTTHQDAKIRLITSTS